jgi:glycosyltransferase involved in cell wall biosynthesis
MPRRRICVAAPQFPYVRGGAELHADLLVVALREAGHEVELVTLPYIWTKDESSLEQCLAWRMVDVATEIAGIDLVIATKFPSYLIRHPNKVAWIFHQQREVYDLHATPFGRLSAGEGDRGLRQAVVELDLRGLGENRALFANSRNTASRVARYCGIEARPLYAPPKLHKDLQPGPYGDYLLYVGRLDRIKRIDLTIRAMAETRGAFTLKIAGKGPHLEELQRTVTELGLHRRVEFLGFVSDEDVVELYAGCFAVALTPHDEDYGFTTLEAFFAGKPVVTTDDSGGVLEWVQDGTTGFVTPPEAALLAEKIDELAADRSLCERQGTAGRERVQTEVSWPLAIEALTATLD